MTEPICTLDLERMRRDRVAKLDAAMDAAGVDTLVLCGQQNVSYATGARVPAADHVRASWWRAVAVLERGAPWPHLYTDFPEGAPPELPDEFLHRAVEVETADGRGRARRRARRRAARDRRRAVPVVGRAAALATSLDAGAVLGAGEGRRRPPTSSSASGGRRRSTRGRCASSARSPCPASRATELSGAFLRAVAELGATANTVDPVFQVMPRVGRRRPVQRHRRTRLPDPRRATRELRRGDVMWIDTGINLHGYASDFGATWIVGREPERRRARPVRALARGRRPCARAQCEPGATAADLVAAARLDDGRAAVAVVLLSGARHRYRQRGDAVRRDRPRRRLRRRAHAAAGDGARVRAGHLGRRAAPATARRRSSR